MKKIKWLISRIGIGLMSLGIGVLGMASAYGGTDITFKNTILTQSKLIPGPAVKITQAEVYLHYHGFEVGKKEPVKKLLGLSRDFGPIDLTGTKDNKVNTVGMMAWTPSGKQYTWQCYTNNYQALDLAQYAGLIKITVYVMGITYTNSGPVLQCQVVPGA